MLCGAFSNSSPFALETYLNRSFIWRNLKTWDVTRCPGAISGSDRPKQPPQAPTLPPCASTLRTSVDAHRLKKVVPTREFPTSTVSRAVNGLCGPCRVNRLHSDRARKSVWPAEVDLNWLIVEQWIGDLKLCDLSIFSCGCEEYRGIFRHANTSCNKKWYKGQKTDSYFCFSIRKGSGWNSAAVSESVWGDLRSSNRGKGWGF